VTHLSRRGFLAGVGAATLLAACGGGDDAGGDGTGTEGELSIVRFFHPDIATADGTPQRLPFGVADSQAALTLDAPAEIEMRWALEDSSLGDPVTVPRHADGVPIPYYPLIAPFETGGIYTLEMHWDGGSATGPFQLFDPGVSPLLAVGSPLPAVETPTTADARGVDPVCTRPAGACPFHDVTLAEALAGGKPVALLVSTPAFCQTAVCGPVLEMLIEAAPDHADMTFVHAEVYVRPGEENPPITITPVMEALGMAFEPSLFVTDHTGVVRTRLDHVFDVGELAAALEV
jgi:hypothetical protein